jgi:carboxyl-terminal processing protease
VQGIFPLGHVGAGLRLTTAKFYSPQGRPISNAGVAPDITVRETLKPAFASDRSSRPDAALKAAVQAARQQLAKR